jgi:glycerol-3-phosphate dehydrogenase (NAD(P)+)
MTFAGLAGMGDVIATAYSPLSRNRRAGEMIARGATAAEAARASEGVVEGVDATVTACALAGRYGVDMPITEALRLVLVEGAPATSVVRGLLEREPKSERR